MLLDGVGKTGAVDGPDTGITLVDTLIQRGPDTFAGVGGAGESLVLGQIDVRQLTLS